MLAEVGAQLPMERVHFLGRLAYADYLRVLQISACHVYLTYPFVLSWRCLEAMSVGRVVVASRTGPVEDVIARLLLDPAQARRLGEAGRQRAATHFTSDQRAELIRQLLR